jgi:iron complex transport system permease protein
MKYGYRKPLQLTLIFLLVISLPLFIGISTGMGYIKIPFFDVFNLILSKLFTHTDINNINTTVIIDVRLPRILTASIVGGGLAISGVVFQAILLNPLADPYTLGVSTGAAFGASLAILLTIITGTTIFSVSLFAFICAVLTLFFVIYLSSGNSGLSSNDLILSGIIVSAILSAGISFIKYIADEQVSLIIFWLMGSFSAATWIDVILTLIFVFTGFIIFIFYSRDLNLMAMGEKSAGSLGVNTKQVTIILLITSSMVTAICVSVSGIIGFIGLLVPHIIRSITGPDNRKLLPLSFFAGAIILLSADTITRAVLPVEIPIGVLTSLIGGPFFCYVFKKQHMAKQGF